MEIKHCILSFATLSLLYSLNGFAELPADYQSTVKHTEASDTATMNIRIIVNGQILSATLDDNPTTRDFVSLLPLTVELEDYAGTEKIVYLSRKLTTEDAPPGVDPDLGDITYYAPWGNLALFYKDFGYAKGLIRLGHIEGDMSLFKTVDAMSVRIEISKD